MAHVFLPTDLRHLAGGAEEIHIDAGTVGRLIQELDRRHPGLGAYVDRRMAIAIDGEIHQDAWFSPLSAESEVCLIPKLGGG